jgi:predicted AlkP superfamily phosphohydrolase/phosphomutase
MTVFLFGLDGLSLQNLHDIMQTTSLPHFRLLLQEGYSSSLKSVHPYVTAPNWTSIFSGVNPGRHGIFDMSSLRGKRRIVPNMRDCDVPFVWDYVSWAGKRMLSMGVPFCRPPPIVNGWWVSGRFTPNFYCYPSNLSSIYDLSGFEYKNISTQRRMKIMEKIGIDRYSEEVLVRLEKRKKAMLKMLDSSTWDFILLVDELPDKLFHYAYGDWKLMGEMFIRIDEWLGEILNRMRKNDSLIVVTDHGFELTSKTLYLGEWLTRNGYIVKKWADNYQRTPYPSIVRQLISYLVDISRRKSYSLYHFTFGFLKNLVEELKKEVYQSLRVQEEITFLTTLEKSKHCWIKFSKNAACSQELSFLKTFEPLIQRTIIYGIAKPADLYSGVHKFEAPGDLLVETVSGWSINTSKIRNDTITEGSAGRLHSPEGLVIIHKEELNIKRERKPNVYDILPTILTLLRLPLPEGLDGTTLLE